MTKINYESKITDNNNCMFKKNAKNEKTIANSYIHLIMVQIIKGDNANLLNSKRQLITPKGQIFHLEIVQQSYLTSNNNSTRSRSCYMACELQFGCTSILQPLDNSIFNLKKNSKIDG